MTFDQCISHDEAKALSAQSSTDTISIKALRAACANEAEFGRKLKENQKAFSALVHLAWIAFANRPTVKAKVKSETARQRRARLAPLVVKSQAEVIETAFSDFRLQDGSLLGRHEVYEFNALIRHAETMKLNHQEKSLVYQREEMILRKLRCGHDRARNSRTFTPTRRARNHRRAWRAFY